MKTVSFNPKESLCTYSEAQWKLTDEIIFDSWYQGDEEAKIQEDAAIIGLEVQSSERGARLRFASKDLSEKCQIILTRWSRFGDEKRGLEVFADREFAMYRAASKKKIVRAVLYCQNRLNQEGETSFSQRGDVFRNVSSVLSKDAYKFARMMGIADEAACASHSSKTKRSGSFVSEDLPHRLSAHKKLLLSSNNSSNVSDDNSYSSTIPVDSQQCEKEDHTSAGVGQYEVDE